MKQRLQSQADVCGVFYRSMELVRVKNRIEAEKLKRLVQPDLERERIYYLKSIQRQQEHAKSKIERTDLKIASIKKRAIEEADEFSQRYRQHEILEARQNFLNLFIKFVNRIEVRTPPDEVVRELRKSKTGQPIISQISKTRMPSMPQGMSESPFLLEYQNHKKENFLQLPIIEQKREQCESPSFSAIQDKRLDITQIARLLRSGRALARQVDNLGKD